MRDSASSPSMQIQGKSVSGVLSNSVAPKCCCNSRSDGMQRFPNSVGLRGFGDEHLERRDFTVPFDQRRTCPDVPNRGSIEIPYGLRHVRAMAVYAYLVLPDAIDHMTSEMKLLHGACRHPVQVGERVESVVTRTDVEVVHIEQNAATGLTHERRQEFPLGDL